MKFQPLPISDDEITIEFGNIGEKSLQLSFAEENDVENSVRGDKNNPIENISGETKGSEHEQMPSAVIVAFAVNYVMGTVSSLMKFHLSDVNSC